MIKLYIAQSLDGYIAQNDGSIDWLTKFSDENLSDYGYNDFISNVDTLIMGRKTYESILSFVIEWPYSEENSYVVPTDNSFIVTTPKTFITKLITEDFIAKIKSESKKNIWLVGGGNLILSFQKHDAIDEYYISIIPILLGNGISLFAPNTIDTKLMLCSFQSFESGIVNVIYKR